VKNKRKEKRKEKKRKRKMGETIKRKKEKK
jgi:hypothetical protein